MVYGTVRLSPVISRTRKVIPRYLWSWFQGMTERPEEVQQQLLRRLLSTNRDTAFLK